ncbi:MAG: V-type proton ATPase subunit E [Aigarchaeota archaeon]|nr:V-type proton ATPase subunit E [Aigarchaeota archaeon]MDW8092457.1 V-type ATP synthase subunit E family protein [Nitrososphaerota archaeon]
MSASLEKIIEEIVNEALAEYVKQIDEAREEAKRRMGELRENLTAELKQKREAVAREVAAYKLKIMSQAELESKRLQLQELDRAIEMVFSRSIEKIRGVKNSKRYEEAIRKMLYQSISAINTESVSVYCSPEDARLVENVSKSLSRELNRSIVVEDDHLDCIGGVKVSSSDGKVLIDNTLETRLTRLKESLRSDVARRLLEDL